MEKIDSKSSGFYFRYFFISLIMLNVFSCGVNKTVKPSSSVNSSPALSVRNEASNGDTSGLKSADANNLKSFSKEKFKNTHASLSGQNIDASVNGDYILGSEDLIEIEVFEVKELNSTARISASGFIHFPLVGKVKASGLTIPEFEAELSRRLEKYLQEPVVSVFVKEYRSQRITVLGAVNKPRVHIVTRQNYLLDVVSLSGGFSNAVGEICYIRRGSETIVININELLIDGNISLNVPVFAGDVIHVPVGGILFVDGGVGSPGSYIMRGKVTLTQAISMAKGFDYAAIKSDVKIYRDVGNEKRDIIPVNYNSILADKEPDIVLQDKDIVIVPTSSFKEFVRSLGGAVSFGSSSVSGGL